MLRSASRLLALVALGLPATALAVPLFDTPTVVIAGSSPGGELGNAIAAVGDVDQDGYEDVVVGAYATDVQGAAWWFPGSATGLHLEDAVAVTNGVTGSVFGTAVAGPGDVNGDGYPDVVVGAPSMDTATGGIYLYLGGPDGLSATAAQEIPGPGVTTNFGAALAGVGDVTGDGYADVLVGAPWQDTFAGAMYLYVGGPDGLTVAAAWASPSGIMGGGFGFVLANAGDVNADGLTDAVACDSADAWIYLGTGTGFEDTPSTELTLATATATCRSAAGVGDVNGDGVDDVVIGSDTYDSYAGAAGVYLGSAAGISADAAVLWTGAEMLDQMGVAAAAAGDVNADGYADVVLGGGGGLPSDGAAWLFLGGATLPSTANTTLAGEHDGDFFGYAVGGADIDGDGLSDLLVGAIGASAYTGTLSIYSGPLEDLDGDGSPAGTDCDDTDAAVYPGAEELIGDGVDQDCDGAELCYFDYDGDGWWASTTPDADPTCSRPGELSAGAPGGDCDDHDPAVHPDGAEAVADGVDGDCDGLERCWADADRDLARSDAATVDVPELGCDAAGEALADAPIDCDDADPTCYPGATDIPGDGIDQDCDGADLTGGDTGSGDTGADDSGTDETASDGTGDSGAAGDTGDAPDKGGCGCASDGQGAAGWVGLLGVGLIAGRRRR